MQYTVHRKSLLSSSVDRVINGEHQHLQNNQPFQVRRKTAIEILNCLRLPLFVNCSRSSSPVDMRAAQSNTVLACLNIRSLFYKFDDVVELCRDRRIDLLRLTES
jgi:hypothetical protein